MPLQPVAQQTLPKRSVPARARHRGHHDHFRAPPVHPLVQLVQGELRHQVKSTPERYRLLHRRGSVDVEFFRGREHFIGRQHVGDLRSGIAQHHHGGGFGGVVGGDRQGCGGAGHRSGRGLVGA
jgi:hypothetical protein